MRPGQTFPFTAVVRNLGQSPWGPGYGLKFLGSGDWGVKVIPVTGTVAPGEKTQFTATLKAPHYLGDRTLAFALVDPAGHLFMETTPYTSIHISEDDAQFLSQRVPKTVIAGSEFYVQHAFKNTGATTWTTEADYHVRTEFGLRHHFPGHPSVKPGDQVTVTGKDRAPFKLGPFPLTGQMSHSNYFFGAKSPTVMVTALPGPDLAQFVKQVVTPSTVEVTMVNVGTQAWGEGYALASVGYDMRHIEPIACGIVAPGQQHTFSVAYKHPRASDYHLRFQMQHNGKPISDPTPDLTVSP